MTGLVFILGLIVGVLLTLPGIVLAVRRTRVHHLRLAQRARSAERLAELGMLTGGLAHEIKNPLSTIGLNLQLIQEDLRDIPLPNTPAPIDPSPAARAQLDHALAVTADKVSRIARRSEALARETHRLRSILEEFLRFAGRVRLDRVPTDVNAMVQELADFFAPQARQDAVKLRLQLSPVPTVQLDPALFKQALLNLMINATQAMAGARQGNKPHGGAQELILRTEACPNASPPEVCLHVIDTGPGISPEHLAKIFQPYFTTKKSGTGLGLPTTRRLIEEHGGDIRVHTDLGRGTDFVIALPSEPPTELPPSPPATDHAIEYPG